NQNPQIAEQQITQFETALPEHWETSGLDTLNEDIAVYERTGKQVLTEIYRRGVIALNNKFQSDRTHYNFTLLTDNVASQRNTAEVFTLETAMDYARRKIGRASWRE